VIGMIANPASRREQLVKERHLTESSTRPMHD
jgi:hypothetical protein